jgi:hypothetical protein
MKILVTLLLLSSSAQADIIVSSVVKDGPNGYIASGTSSSVTNGVNHVTTTNTFNVSNRVEIVPGLRVQYLTNASPWVFGVGAFTDSTLEASIGIRL